MSGKGSDECKVTLRLGDDETGWNGYVYMGVLKTPSIVNLCVRFPFFLGQQVNYA